VQSNLKLADNRVLTPEQVSTFERDGFVVIRGMFDAAEMQAISTWTDDVQNYPEVPGKYMMYYEKSLIAPGQRVLQRVENFYPYHRAFAELFDSPRLRGAVGELLGGPAVLFKEKINFKLPGGDGFKPHQDQQAGWWTYSDFFITVLVSIDEATLENGCLELAAGHHKRGLVGGEWAPLTDEQIADMDMRPYPTEPGDVVFFDSYAPHGSGPNLSDRPRRVLYATYNRLSDGDHRLLYYADKRNSFPPDIERDPNKEYKFRV
jgi:ectoine hydroxylase-related dioxygenase (phytanoyl-CoA dioxygenase family)